MTPALMTPADTWTDGATVEVATIVHEGREFTNIGAVQDPAAGVIVAYVGLVKDPSPGHARHCLATWDGTALGPLTLVSSWEQRIPGRHYCPRVTFYAWRFVAADGRVHHGRNAGPGMIVRLRTRAPRAGGAS